MDTEAKRITEKASGDVAPEVLARLIETAESGPPTVVLIFDRAVFDSLQGDRMFGIVNDTPPSPAKGLWASYMELDADGKNTPGDQVLIHGLRGNGYRVVGLHEFVSTVKLSTE